MADHFATRFTALGGAVTEHVSFPARRPTSETNSAPIAAAPPDVLFFVLLRENGAPFGGCQARATVGLEATVLASTDDTINEELVEELGTDAEGIVLSARTSGSSTTSRTSAPSSVRTRMPSATRRHARTTRTPSMRRIRLLDVIESFRRGRFHEHHDPEDGASPRVWGHERLFGSDRHDHLRYQRGLQRTGLSHSQGGGRRVRGLVRVTEERTGTHERCEHVLPRPDQRQPTGASRSDLQAGVLRDPEDLPDRDVLIDIGPVNGDPARRDRPVLALELSNVAVRGRA